MARNLAAHLRLMAVTDDRVLAGRDLIAASVAAVEGGATAVQLRLKDAPPRELVGLARELVRRLPVPVLINDRLDVALAAGAGGVHLGGDDLPVARARALVPPGFVIGASVGDEGEAARVAGADYWGVGPWRMTGTKADAGAALGPAGFRRIGALAGLVPCVAIGGVTPADVPDVLGAGGVGVAVVSGIFGGPDPAAGARRYAEALAE